MKFTFSTNEEEDARMILNAHRAHNALSDVANMVFRPARKHGYPDAAIQTLLEKIGEDGYELISLLEKLFYEIRESHNIDVE